MKIKILFAVLLLIRLNSSEANDNTVAALNSQNLVREMAATQSGKRPLSSGPKNEIGLVKKTEITSSASDIYQAIFYVRLQRKIEKIGTCNFPMKDGEKLYGELIIYIPVYQDGSIYQKDAGVRIKKSSGSRALDDAALAIVERAAPFEPIPQNLRTPGKEDVWEVTSRFAFTKDDSERPGIDCDKDDR